ncbi:uncharacterized protein ASCRUDRAFT_9635 [Ascoidea rubescens DSM 1968]|uniref:Uncharacterized protein n=1 Tax=Ascoidea rubescens DSM 1968 TaxID=1344418 RepID=A0A1D2VCK5_9ASCO|nr:hypothetical protein ASCRUDRAFT_9635 [Ascoidea rubescens DSM 1968]ODV59240.1 hypothetical protein ASCRUDRAFT_9635 [Ascoidea rubescens DSM 1968]
MNSTSNTNSRSGNSRRFSETNHFLVSHFSTGSSSKVDRNTRKDSNSAQSNNFLLVNNYKTREQVEKEKQIVTILNNDDLVILFSLQKEEVKLPPDREFDTKPDQYVSIISNNYEKEYPMSTTQARYNLIKKMMRKD